MAAVITHISVPEYSLVSDADGSKYHAFEVHINGAYHADIRYSQLLRLHESLKTGFPNQNLPEFPPKKIRQVLSEKQLEERRSGIHRYLQFISQQSELCSHSTVVQFFLEAQASSFKGSETNVELEIFRADGFRHLLRCPPTTPTSKVLQILGHSAGIHSENIDFFALFIVCKGGKPYSVVRWLKNFESPYISLNSMNQRLEDVHKIIVRKSCWDLSWEEDLLNDDGAVNLLFSQAVSEVKCGALRVSADVLQKLRSLQQTRSLKQYVKLCQIQKRYGYLELDACVSDYPQPRTRTELSVGHRQILFTYKSSTGEPVESVFRVTRIRGWKLVYQGEKETLNFTFEYLMAREHFEWITLETPQAVLLSQCLQSMGAEILRSRGSPVSGSQSVVSQSVPPSRPQSSAISYESFQDVLSLPAFKLSSSPVSNDAFNTITDDDL